MPKSSTSGPATHAAATSPSERGATSPKILTTQYEHEHFSYFPATVASGATPSFPSLQKEINRVKSAAIGGKQLNTFSTATGMPKSSHVVALEGLIGVGKSTLCTRLTDAYPNDCDVYKEQTNEKFLQLFYSDPKRYGFALQWGMLKSRIYQLRLAQHDAKYGRRKPIKYYFWDRSMIGDYIFALWNHLQGGISPAEMAVYESEFGGSLKQLELVPFLSDIDMFVFMDDEPFRCKERVELLRKNPSEQGIPLGYYDGLDDIHFHILLTLLTRKLSKVLVLSWAQFQETLPQELFTHVLDGTTKQLSVEAANLDEIEAAGEDCVVYKSEADVQAFYKKIKSRSHTVPHLTGTSTSGMAGSTTSDVQVLKPRKVYIPENIMTIDQKDKNIVHNDYHINFYENAYKRVVMWHLAQRHDIALFRAQ